uniref:Uncharacterized protein n=1 Tax=Arundo donax TaxID=35708 RepID=A0A0A8XXT7_ARUDO
MKQTKLVFTHPFTTAMYSETCAGVSVCIYSVWAKYHLRGGGIQSPRQRWREEPHAVRPWRSKEQRR